MENEFNEGQKEKIRFTDERNDRFWTGLIFILVGGALFLDKMGAGLPGWLFTWPMILIIIGLISGFKHRFRDHSWIIITLVGLFFLWNEVVTNLDLQRFFWPVLFLALGLLFIFRPKRKWYRRHRRERWMRMGEKMSDGFGGGPETISKEDMIDSASIFGGVKKVITSKNFKGGEILCFMGGAEYNLSQADITGPISIEIIQLFGGTKLVVPPHWEIRTEGIAIFAGIEDKRPVQPGTFDPNKILILRGTSIFGGIEIRSF